MLHLPLEMTNDELRQEFAVFGQVASVKIINDKYIGSGQPCGYGFERQGAGLLKSSKLFLLQRTRARRPSIAEKVAISVQEGSEDTRNRLNRLPRVTDI